MCKMGSARQREEMNRLFWLSLNEDFADKNRFAGDQNIAYIMNVALQYPIPENTFVQDGLYIGVDGCRGGWIAAVLNHGYLQFKKYDRIDKVIAEYPEFSAFLIDMAIGLRNNPDEIRPDDAAKKELGEKAPSVFPIPSRLAVYTDGEDAQKEANKKTLGKSLAKQSIAIIPKIRELDEFLNAHTENRHFHRRL